MKSPCPSNRCARTTATLMLLAGILPGQESPSAAITGPRWQPHDFEFSGDSRAENPYATPFAAEITGPNGAHFTLPGFHDGGNLWKIRFAPTITGRWSLVTHSEDPALDHRTASMLCTPALPGEHGPLRIDTEHPHHFRHDDGTHRFLMTYECDWLWALDPTTTNRFLDRISTAGFNGVILNSYANDTTWRKGRTGPDDHGPPPMDPWAGTNENPDHSRMNPAYWRSYDQTILALAQRGIQAHILIKVCNKAVNWPAPGSENETRFLRWLVARYAAFPNIQWDVSKEAQYIKNPAEKLDTIARIRRLDPYHHLLTVHDDRRNYDNGTYLNRVDFRTDQQHGDWHRSLLDHRSRAPWPVLNSEFGYEQGPGGPNDRTYGIAQDAREVARRAWDVTLAGGYVTYYYTYTAWDVIRPDDIPPGENLFHHLRDIMETTAWWRMEPADQATGGKGFCLADPGHEYLVMLTTPATVTLDLPGWDHPLDAVWVHPWSGRRETAPAIHTHSTTLHPPVAWGDEPLILHVGTPSAP